MSIRVLFKLGTPVQRLASGSSTTLICMFRFPLDEHVSCACTLVDLRLHASYSPTTSFDTISEYSIVIGTLPPTRQPYVT